MVKDEPVSLMRQTIYVLIPILDLIAFYRIKHLRKYLLIIYVGVVGVLGTVYSLTLTPEAWAFNENYDPNFLMGTEGWLYQIPMIAISYSISIYLVRRWSKEWNKKFKSI